MGNTGTRAVKAPMLEVPYPTAAVSSRLASVQFNESIPWLQDVSDRALAHWAGPGHTRRALLEGWMSRFGALACRQCCPLWSTYTTRSLATSLEPRRLGRLTSTCQTQNYNIPTRVPTARAPVSPRDARPQRYGNSPVRRDPVRRPPEAPRSLI